MTKMYKYLWGKCKLKKINLPKKELINKIVGKKIKIKKFKNRLGKKSNYLLNARHKCLFVLKKITNKWMNKAKKKHTKHDWEQICGVKTNKQMREKK